MEPKDIIRCLASTVHCLTAAAAGELNCHRPLQSPFIQRMLLEFFFHFVPVDTVSVFSHHFTDSVENFAVHYSQCIFS